MDSWQQEWQAMLEGVAREVDQFFQDIAEEMVEAVEAFFDFSEDMAEQIEQAIAPGIEQTDEQVETWVEPLLQAVNVIEASYTQATQPFVHTLEPILNEHKVCIGCLHYHGQTYNEVMLVCAMHPYGMEEVAACPDKELFGWAVDHSSSDG